MENKPDMAKIKEIKNIIENIPEIENMVSSRSGKEVPNQYIIRFKDNGFNCKLFKSYNSPIALIRYTSFGEKVFIFKDWDYSKTTGKYRNDFLGESKKETERKLKSGEYIAVDFEVSL